MEEDNLDNPKFDLNKFLFGSLNKRFVFILLILLVCLITMGLLIVYFQNQVLENQFNKAIVESEDDFNDIKDESIRTLSAALEIILQDGKMKEVYLEKDREKLFEYGHPLFQDLKDKYQITHFYFIEPNGINFVRLHNKGIYGDEIKRTTFLKSKETGGVGAGIELGKTAYALRVVMPYYEGGELIGYVELGQEIDEFFKIMKKEENNEFSLVVEKGSLNEDDWRSVRENKGLRNNWDDFEEYIVITSTTEEVFPCFLDENVNKLRQETSLFGKSKLDDDIFACGGFSLIDASNEKSGAVFSLIDVTEEQMIMTRIRVVILTILSLIIIIFFMVGFYVFKKITKPIEELTSANERIRKKDFKARVDIKTGDELETLGKTFNETARVLDNMDKEHGQLEHAKTEFLSITSHELRSPMTPMKAQLQMLMGDYFGKLNTKQRNSIDIVLRNTDRLDNIIVDFLEISRIEAARLKFRFLRKSPNHNIERLIKEMEGFMAEKKIKIISKVDKLPIFEHDPDRLSQILRNLINNAIKFSPENTTIVVSGKLSNGEILFSVKDEGIGIKSEDQKRLFEPFYQVENMYQHKSGGTGLGLAIVRGIVESQNGKIWIKSEVGKGTIFYFTLPLKPVRKIKPIKLLFSEQQNIEDKVKVIFVEFLGTIGDQEFEILNNKNQINERGLVEYINFLLKRGILNEERGEVFKVKILDLFGKRLKVVNSESLKQSGLIARSKRRINTGRVIKGQIDKSLEEKIKKVYIEMLGERGENYFRKLDVMDLNIIIPQIDLLVAKSLLTNQKGEEFKNKIILIFK